jgi:hypothetical protein
MGVRGLLSFLRGHSEIKTFAELLQQPKQRIGFDISYYLYKWQGDSTRILTFLNKIKQSGHSIILVFDGRAEDGKQEESKRRKVVRSEELRTAQCIQLILDKQEIELTNDQREHLKHVANEHEKRGWQLTREIRHKIKEEFYRNKFPLLKAVGEADTLLTSLAIRNDIDIVISGDMDLLVLGSPLQYVPFDDGYKFYAFDRREILQKIGINDAQFRIFCAMCSTESATSSLTIPDIRKAYHGIRICKTLDSLKSRHNDWLDTWPRNDHIFFRDLSDISKCIREDELPRYYAFIKGSEMPYYDEIDPLLV